MAIGYAAALRPLYSQLTASLGVPSLRWNDPRYLAVLAQSIHQVDPSITLDPRTLLQISVEARRQSQAGGGSISDDTFDNLVQGAATGGKQYIPPAGPNGSEYYGNLAKGNTQQFLPSSVTQQQQLENALTTRGGEGNVAGVLLNNEEGASGGKLAGGFRNFLLSAAPDLGNRALLHRAAGITTGGGAAAPSVVDEMAREYGSANAGAGFNQSINGADELNQALNRVKLAFGGDASLSNEDRTSLKAFGGADSAATQSQRDAIKAALGQSVGAPLRNSLNSQVDDAYNNFVLGGPQTTSTGGFLEYAKGLGLY